MFLGSAHRPIGLKPNLRIRDAPDFTAVIHADDPEQIELRPIVDHRDGETGAAINDVERDGRIELGERHDGGTSNGIGRFRGFLKRPLSFREGPR